MFRKQQPETNNKYLNYTAAETKHDSCQKKVHIRQHVSLRGSVIWTLTGTLDVEMMALFPHKPTLS